MRFGADGVRKMWETNQCSPESLEGRKGRESRRELYSWELKAQRMGETSMGDGGRLARGPARASRRMPQLLQGKRLHRDIHLGPATDQGRISQISLLSLRSAATRCSPF